MTRPIEFQNMVSQAKAAEKLQRVGHHQPADEQQKFAKELSDRTKEKSRKPAETEKGEQAVIKEDKEGRGENKGKKKNNRSETAGSGGDEITNETDKAGWHDDESETLERNRKIGGKIDLNA